MKKIMDFGLSVWCIFGFFITPIWITLIYLNISGAIYQYDYSMDEGTALILGVVFLLIWMVLVLLPSVILLKQVRKRDNKKMIGILILFVLSIFFGVATTGWDTVAFWVK